MKRTLFAVAAAGMLAVSMAGGVAAESKARGCPGNANSAQANAGTRNELVAAAKAGTDGNFGEIQSDYNKTCDNGKP